MRNKMIKKILVCAIIFLFFGLVISSIASSISMKKNSSNEKSIYSFLAPPVIDDFVWELSGCKCKGWTVTFTVTCHDDTSGMDRVEFSLDDEMQFIDNTPPSPFDWILEDPFDIPEWENKIIKAIVFDKTGNSAFITMPASEIKSKSFNRFSSQWLSNLFIFQLLIQFLKLTS